MDENTERIPNTIITCCVLNNMCILLQDDFDAPQGNLCLDQNVGKDDVELQKIREAIVD